MDPIRQFTIVFGRDTFTIREDRLNEGSLFYEIFTCSDIVTEFKIEQKIHRDAVKWYFSYLNDPEVDISNQFLKKHYFDLKYFADPTLGDLLNIVDHDYKRFLCPVDAEINARESQYLLDLNEGKNPPEQITQILFKRDDDPSRTKMPPKTLPTKIQDLISFNDGKNPLEQITQILCKRDDDPRRIKMRPKTLPGYIALPKFKFCSYTLEKYVSYRYASDVTEMLSNWNNVVVAGGMAHGIARIKNTEINSYVGDIDMFIYGVDQAGAADIIMRIWRDLNLWANRINRTQYESYLLIVSESNVITIYGETTLRRHFKLQIILTIYRTKTEILYNFDLDPACFLYDGRDIYTTERGMRSINDKTIIVNPEQSSAALVYRLCKYRHLYDYEIHIPCGKWKNVFEKKIRKFEAKFTGVGAGLRKKEFEPRTSEIEKLCYGIYSGQHYECLRESGYISRDNLEIENNRIGAEVKKINEGTEEEESKLPPYTLQFTHTLFYLNTFTRLEAETFAGCVGNIRFKIQEPDIIVGTDMGLILKGIQCRQFFLSRSNGRIFSFMPEPKNAKPLSLTLSQHAEPRHTIPFYSIA